MSISDKMQSLQWGVDKHILPLIRAHEMCSLKVEASKSWNSVPVLRKERLLISNLISLSVRNRTTHT
jgi:hypothetical protein